MSGRELNCIQARLDRGLWIVNLNCPSRLNALSTGVLQHLKNIIADVPEDAKATVVLGEGKVFSAGVDLAEIAGATSPEEARRPFRALADAMREFLRSSVPVMLLLEAPAIGGGAELALASDVILATRGAKLVWPETFWGLVPPLLSSLLGSMPLPVLAWASLGGELGIEEITGLGLGVKVRDRLDGLERARVISSRWVDRDAVLKALEHGRRRKLEALNTIISELYGLADMSLVERAKRFLEAKRKK